MLFSSRSNMMKDSGSSSSTSMISLSVGGKKHRPFPQSFIYFQVLTLMLILMVPMPFKDSLPTDLYESGYVVKDPFFHFPSPKIKWVSPESLVPHEYTSKPHLLNLIKHLQNLSTTAPVPVPVVTSSYPQVILDGHHRVAASCTLGIRKIPVWEVDIGDDYPPSPQPLTAEQELQNEGDRTSILCYKSADNSRIMIKDVVDSARSGTVGFGIKGTRHVAVVGSDGLEVQLEKVTPRVMWGVWASSGRLNATDLIVKT